MDITLSAPSFCRQISPEEFEYQRAYGSQEPLAALLEEVIADAKLSNKEKKKKLKQVTKLVFRRCLALRSEFSSFYSLFNGLHVNLIRAYEFLVRFCVAEIRVIGTLQSFSRVLSCFTVLSASLVDLGSNIRHLFCYLT